MLQYSTTSYPDPSPQFRNVLHHEVRQEARNVHFLHLPLYKVLHLIYSNIWEGELSLLITVTAVHRALRSIGFSTAPLWVFQQGHSATLAALVGH